MKQLKISIYTLIFAIAFTSVAYTQDSATPLSRKENKKAMDKKASGTFEVKLLPLEGHSPDASPKILSIDKKFQGELDAESTGQMLAAGTNVSGSAGYVAIEKVTGTLNGKKGSFILQHTGIMTRGTPQLTVTILPDSGTDELTGISGEMSIKIENGKHFYEFKYTIQ